MRLSQGIITYKMLFNISLISNIPWTHMFMGVSATLNSTASIISLLSWHFEHGMHFVVPKDITLTWSNRIWLIVYFCDVWTHPGFNVIIYQQQPNLGLLSQTLAFDISTLTLTCHFTTLPTWNYFFMLFVYLWTVAICKLDFNPFFLLLEGKRCTTSLSLMFPRPF